MQLVDIINKAVKPIADDLGRLRSDVINRVNTLENKVSLLEVENSQLQENVLTDIIGNMQTSD